MTGRETITTFLRSHVKYHGSDPSPELLLLKKGTWFEGRCHSDDYESTKIWRKQNRPRSRRCYHNAQLYCCEDKTAKYYEGYALISTTFAPVPHAWVAMPDRGVVDFTFEAMERKAKREKLRCDTSATVYVGFEVPRRVIVRAIAEDGETQPFAESYFVAILLEEMLRN